VIPTPEQLEEISRLNEGSLHETPFPVLLTALAVHKRTQVLEVSRRQITKKVMLEQGMPVDCRSNLVHETLGRFMATEGKLSEEEAHNYFGESAARGVPFGVVLIEHDRITPDELHRVLQQNLAKKLLDLFTWQEGDFRMHFDAAPSALGLKIKAPQLILMGITKLLPQREVDAAVVSLVGKKLALNPAPPFSLDELRLSPSHSQAALALRAGWRIDELALGTGLPFEELTRLLYALTLLGVVITADRLPRTSPPAVTPSPQPVLAHTTAPLAPLSAAAAAPAALAPAPRPPGEDFEPRRTALMQAFLRLRKQDAFELLSLDEDSTPREIDERFLAFAQQYAPWSLPPELSGLAEKACELFLSGSRAYAEVADAEQRHTLIFRRRTLREERARRPVEVGIKTDLLDPQAQFRKGIALRDGGKYREAVLQLEFAADCDPQNAIYTAELAYTRYLLSPNTASRLLRDLDETLRMEPDCGLAHFYSGELHRQLGHFTEAEDSFRKAIKLMSPDRRPIEALKNLSTVKRR